MTEKLVLGLDIGGTHVRTGLVDSNYKLSHFVIEPTPTVLGTDPVANITNFIKCYCDKYLDGGRPEAISLGFPSTISKDRRTILSTPNIPHLNNVPIAELLEEALETRVFINRDVNLLLLFDIYYFTIDRDSTVIAIYYGTGLGNAVMVGGNLLLGKNGVASELGHIPLLDNPLICGCGNVGCLETLASGRYLETLRQERFPDTEIQDMFTAHWPSPELEKYLYYLSLPAVTEINIFDPDHIILGGGILHMDGFPYDALIEVIRSQVRKPLPEENLSFIQAHQEQENGVIGAGIYGQTLIGGQRLKQTSDSNIKKIRSILSGKMSTASDMAAVSKNIGDTKESI